MIFEKIRTDPQLPGRNPKRSARFLLLSFCIAFVFLLHTTLALSDDAAKARKKLDDDYISFIPDKFLHYVFMNKVEKVELFLEGGIFLDAADSLGRSALHIAAGAEDGEILSLLLERDVAVNQEDKNGTKPLCVAADDGHVERTGSSPLLTLVHKNRTKYRGLSQMVLTRILHKSRRLQMCEASE